jgi:hypothetical protein
MLIREKKEICNTCEHKSKNDFCNNCGCYIPLKVYVSDCELGKWKKDIIIKEEESKL